MQCKLAIQILKRKREQGGERERERNEELLILENKKLYKKRNITIAYCVAQV